MHVLGLPLGKRGSFLTAQNVVVKLTFESQWETDPHQPWRENVRLREEKPKGSSVTHMAGKTAEHPWKPQLATDTSCALISVLCPLVSTSSPCTFTASLRAWALLHH